MGQKFFFSVKLRLDLKLLFFQQFIVILTKRTTNLLQIVFFSELFLDSYLFGNMVLLMFSYLQLVTIFVKLKAVR